MIVALFLLLFLGNSISSDPVGFKKTISELYVSGDNFFGGISRNSWENKLYSLEVIDNRDKVRTRLRHVENVIEMIRNEGGYINSHLTPFVKSVEFDDIGILTTEHLELGTVLAEIPEHFLVSASSILKDFPLFGIPLMRMNINLNDFENQFCILAMFVIYIRFISNWNDDSFVHQYISTFPLGLDHPFSNITQSQLMLKRHRSFSHIFFSITKRNIRLKLEIVENILQQDETLSVIFGDYRPIQRQDIWYWAFIMIQSRNFLIQGEQSPYASLVPFFDLFNHKSRKYHLSEIDMADGFVSGSITNKYYSVEEGEELFNNYKPLGSNAILLATFGIVVDAEDENPVDTFIALIDQEKKPLEMSCNNLLEGEVLENNMEIASTMKLVLQELHVPYLDSLESVTEEERENVPVFEYLKFEKKEIEKCFNLLTQDTT